MEERRGGAQSSGHGDSPSSVAWRRARVPWLSKDADFCCFRRKDEERCVPLGLFFDLGYFKRYPWSEKGPSWMPRVLRSLITGATCHWLGTLRPPLHHNEAKSLPCGERYPQPTFQFSWPLVLLNSDSEGDRQGAWEVNQITFNDVTLVSILMNHNQKWYL